MDERAIAERGRVFEAPADLYPNRSAEDGALLIAEDPETGCRGVGRFEHEARANLVHAVEAYRNDPGADVGYVSTSRGVTCEMKWRRDDGLTDRLRDALPF